MLPKAFLTIWFTHLFLKVESVTLHIVFPWIINSMATKKRKSQALILGNLEILMKGLFAKVWARDPKG